MFFYVFGILFYAVYIWGKLRFLSDFSFVNNFGEMKAMEIRTHFLGKAFKSVSV